MIGRDDLITLKKIINNIGIIKGRVKLAHGGYSDYYIDMKRVICNPTGLQAISELVLRELIRLAHKTIDIKINTIGGMETGTIPIAAAAVKAVHTEKDIYPLETECLASLSMFYVRKTPKGHGTSKYIEGWIGEEDNILLLEDVITTGTSTIIAANTIMEERPYCNIVKVLAVVDRLQGGAEKIKGAGLGYSSLLTINDLNI